MSEASRPAFSDLDAERDRNQNPWPRDSKLRGFPLQYEYDLLEDANAQIRLLRLAHGANQSHLSFEVSCWPIENAPQYAAISYTWGDDDLLPGIFIDGKILLSAPELLSCALASDVTLLGKLYLDRLHMHQSEQ